MRKFLYGLSILIPLAIAIRLLHISLPLHIQKILGEAILAIVVGLIIGNAFAVPKDLKAGVKKVFGYALSTAIVLLGIRISFEKIIDVGAVALLFVILLMILALTIVYYLGKWLNVSTKLAALIGVGTAVCGNTAISAVAPSIHASDEDMSFAIAVNTLFGTLAVFVYPLVAQYFQFSDGTFGFWAGSAINDTSQVVAAGFSYSPPAGDLATTVKLTRNALMGFVIIAMVLLFKSKEQSENIPLYKKIKIPLFIVLFVVVATLNSLGLFTWVSKNFYHDFFVHSKWLTKSLILVALVGVGINTKFTSLKEIGIKPLLLGFISAITISLTSISCIVIFGFGN